ncbi:hypothetical protein M011DRAFT_462308 [Sporormia fimetaria CBS 119925]|uniref:Uncharacterized protein n=1 Tax=Sporormia fimetaria CBS 119925 TaxID=1340428 RepID=A0A6A6UYM3_9PLEO|nr:hypothetical protein M011DRAFT_462308 [Sporormia fimetaria CBS 119925]
MTLSTHRITPASTSNNPSSSSNFLPPGLPSFIPFIRTTTTANPQTAPPNSGTAHISSVHTGSIHILVDTAESPPPKANLLHESTSVAGMGTETSAGLSTAPGWKESVAGGGRERVDESGVEAWKVGVGAGVGVSVVLVVALGVVMYSMR